jgi:2-polyprenyl-6-methoxyphenol hydroxylase-like FAD-dependent oxidoreductase
MQAQRRAFGQAVVIGGSIAGLLSARVLSEHFEKVLVLERDAHPNAPETSKGTPQGRHIHAVLEAGRKTLDELFPGMVEEMVREGADLIDMGQESAWFHSGSWKARQLSGIHSILSSRPFLEWKVRCRVRALPNVELREGYNVEQLLTDAARGRVTGVRVKGPGGEETLEAALVVDASGRGSRAPQWLEALGYGQPEEEQVGIDLGYTSRFYERPPDDQRDWKILAVYARAPESWRSGFVSNVEGKRWIVSLNGYFGDHPPTTEEGFLEFARSLPTPDIYESIRNAKPLTPPVSYKIQASRWLHFERMPRFLEGFVVLGDAVCAFNPIYGQGMTVISLSAKLLGECVAEQTRTAPGEVRGLARSFQKKLGKLIGVSWFLATTMDLRYPRARGRRPPGLGLVQWSVGNLIDMTSRDAEACFQFYRVLHMRDGLEVLLQPKLVASLLAYSLKSLFVPLHERANVGAMPPAPGPRPQGRPEQEEERLRASA